jgi:hypothetical protein
MRCSKSSVSDAEYLVHHFLEANVSRFFSARISRSRTSLSVNKGEENDGENQFEGEVIQIL